MNYTNMRKCDLAREDCDLSSIKAFHHDSEDITCMDYVQNVL